MKKSIIFFQNHYKDIEKKIFTVSQQSARIFIEQNGAKPACGWRRD